MALVVVCAAVLVTLVLGTANAWAENGTNAGQTDGMLAPVTIPMPSDMQVDDGQMDLSNLRMSRDGKRVFVTMIAKGSGETSSSLWFMDVDIAKQEISRSVNLGENAETFNQGPIAEVPNSDVIYVCADSVYRIDADSHVRVLDDDGFITAGCVLSKDGRFLYAGKDRGRAATWNDPIPWGVNVYDAVSGNLIGQADLSSPQRRVFLLGGTNDGKTAYVSACQSETICSAQSLRIDNGTTSVIDDLYTIGSGYAARSGDFLILRRLDGDLTVLDMESRESHILHMDDSGDPSAFVVADGGGSVGVSNEQGTRIYDTDSGDPIGTVPDTTVRLLSKDGKIAIAKGKQEFTLYVIDSSTGNALARISDDGYRALSDYGNHNIFCALTQGAKGVSIQVVDLSQVIGAESQDKTNTTAAPDGDEQVRPAAGHLQWVYVLIAVAIAGILILILIIWRGRQRRHENAHSDAVPRHRSDSKRSPLTK
ncbi:hypothetical protein [Bifidobacterium aerophilum]|uniref:PQQ-binding-like beta-propeller repeat protein n=1 Tax=Bifidobacterium aerophilum TaxID=1798155 RepID=A0A6N9Z2R1_9BIFI|nr:hypothetical protein [Bifidobacterium aerophilum]NEG88781.1 hypothetical protein [Bifidobacterium aerophilum]